MPFVELIKPLSEAMRKQAVAEFLLLNAKKEIERGFADYIRKSAGHLVSYSPAATIQIEKIEVEAIEDHPPDEQPTNNVFGWATWAAGDVRGNFQFDIGEDEQVELSWLTAVLDLPTKSEKRDSEEEW
jgi:hypothetical protein